MLMKMNIFSFLIIVLPFFVMMMTDSVFLMWVLMEVQTMVFLIYVWNSSKNKSCLMYFILIQMLSSVLIFFSFYLESFLFYKSGSSFFLIVSLLLKMGFFPFASWSLMFIKDLDVSSLFFFLTFLKIIPFFMIFSVESEFFIMFFFLNVLFSCFMLTFYSEYNKILMLSSIFLGSFCIFISSFGSFVLLFFFILVYTFFIYMFLSELNSYNSNFFLMENNFKFSFLFLMFIMVLLGMPFGLGFILKAVIIQFLAGKSSYFFVSLGLFLGSFLFSYFYMKISFFLFKMYINTMKNNFLHKFNYHNFFSMSLLIGSSFLLLPVFLFSWSVLF